MLRFTSFLVLISVLSVAVASPVSNPLRPDGSIDNVIPDYFDSKSGTRAFHKGKPSKSVCESLYLYLSLSLSICVCACVCLSLSIALTPSPPTPTTPHAQLTENQPLLSTPTPPVGSASTSIGPRMSARQCTPHPSSFPRALRGKKRYSSIHSTTMWRSLVALEVTNLGAGQFPSKTQNFSDLPCSSTLTVTERTT